MTDEIINRLIAIRASGQAILNVSPGHLYSGFNEQIHAVADVHFDDNEANVLLIIHGDVVELNAEQVLEVSPV
jgi:uncharacterized protein (DUF952 family)